MPGPDPSDLRRRAQELRDQADALSAHRDLDRAVARAAEALRDEAERILALASELEHVQARAAKAIARDLPRARPVKGNTDMSIPPEELRTRARDMGRGRRKGSHPLYAWLEGQGKSAETYAVELGLSRGAIGHYIRGIRAIPGNLARQIEQQTGVPVDAWAKLRP